MKCDQCEMVFIKLGNIRSNLHERGCPNNNKIWDAEEEKWVKPTDDDEEYDDDWDFVDPEDHPDDLPPLLTND